MNTTILYCRTSTHLGFVRFLLLLVSCDRGLTADWPQFRGPQRDGVSHETNLMKSWPRGGPQRIWLSTHLGAGYSSPAIVGERIFIMGQRADAQWLLCLDAKDGKDRWATRLGDPYANEFGDGPRGTPTVRDGLVFALGANGELLCAEAATGKEHWRMSLTNLGGTVPGWGYSESPLVSDQENLWCLDIRSSGSLPDSNGTRRR